jgi:hypothetical protein
MGATVFSTMPKDISGGADSGYLMFVDLNRDGAIGRLVAHDPLEVIGKQAGMVERRI